jgi:hypothetical protein
MSRDLDLFGRPVDLLDYTAAGRAAALYAMGDRHPIGSPQRADLYRQAADEQRKADGLTALQRKKLARKEREKNQAIRRRVD